MQKLLTFAGLAALTLLMPSRGLAHAVQTNVSSLLPSGAINLRTSFSSGEPLALSLIHI